MCLQTVSKYDKVNRCDYSDRIVFLEDETVKTALTIALIVDCVVLMIVILMQEGKENGLTGTLTGSADTYWSKNKGRSKDAMSKKVTVVLAVLFFVLTAALSSKWM